MVGTILNVPTRVMFSQSVGGEYTLELLLHDAIVAKGKLERKYQRKLNVLQRQNIVLWYLIVQLSACYERLEVKRFELVGENFDVTIEVLATGQLHVYRLAEHGLLKNSDVTLEEINSLEHPSLLLVTGVFTHTQLLHE